MAIPLRLDALPVEVVLDICQTGILDARDLSGLMGTSAVSLLSGSSAKQIVGSTNHYYGCSCVVQRSLLTSV